MANNIEKAKLYQANLDLLASQEAVTSWMDANAGQVVYNGGDEIKIPDLVLSGLADYDRATGYVDGDVTFKYQTHKINHDRGRRFSLDAMDVDETNFTATAGAIMAEFQRLHVIPEVDAVRIAKLATDAVLEETLVVDATPEDAVASFRSAISKVRDAGYAGQLIAHVTYDFKGLLETFYGGMLRAETFSLNGVDTDLPAVDGVALIETTSNKMNTEVTLSATGWAPAGEKVPFIIAPVTSVVGINKQDVPRIFTPEENQDADAWRITYRRFYDAIIPENQAKLIVLGKQGV